MVAGLVSLILTNLLACSGGGASSSSHDPALASTCSSPIVSGSPLTNTLNSARANHTATLLSNGTVLVTGGSGSAGLLISTELYNPTTGQWTATGDLTSARTGHTATLLSNGTVLVAGGSGNAGLLISTELYNPTTGQWATTGDLTVVRASHTATRLLNGTVFVAGGHGSTGPLSSAEIVTPSNGIQVRLTWDHETNPAVRGYRLYYGAAPKSYEQAIDVGLSTAYAFSNLKSGMTYYFVVTAYNSVAEGCSSNEVNKPIP